MFKKFCFFLSALFLSMNVVALHDQWYNDSNHAKDYTFVMSSYDTDGFEVSQDTKNRITARNAY